MLVVIAILLAGIGRRERSRYSLDGLLPQGSASASGRIVQIMAMLTVLSVAPGMLMMVDELQPLRDRAVLPALGSRPAEHAGQSDPDQPRRCS